jgi:hypothetical protein
MLTCCEDEASKGAGASEPEPEGKPRKTFRALRSIRQRIENYFL